MEQCPDADALLAAASARRGLTDFGAAEREVPFRALVEAVRTECWGTMTPPARSLAVDYLVHLLSSRLRLMADRKSHPQIAQEKILRPMIVVGPPRSGSTLVHKLLSLDPDHLSPEHSLCMEPSPPPALGAPSAERITCASERLMSLYREVPDIFLTHPYLIEEGADALAECGSNILNMVFTSQQLWCFYRGESYRQYLLQADHSAALAFHHEFLQHLQWGSNGKRWALKGSDHMLWMEELATQYPDALLIWTHRDLAQQLGSLANTQIILGGVTGNPVTGTARDDVGRLAIEHQHAAIAKAMRTRDRIGSDRCIDVSYHDVMADPVAMMERIYARQGLSLQPAHVDAIRQWLADNPATKHGAHKYSTDEFGLEAGKVNRQFKDYLDRFGFGFGIRPPLTV
jgi:hypothetical protein